jgi:hypothetical protein
LQDYFTEIRRLHHSNPESHICLYVCPVVFDRNSQETPAVVRFADIMWANAAIASMVPWSSLHFPVSIYSLPMSLAVNIGGWDGDKTAIGEDLHILLKTFFSTGGRLATVPVFSPASQCNVSCAQEIQGWRRSAAVILARYHQAVRHMWGCLDTGYAIRSMIKRTSFRFAHLVLFEGLWEFHLIPTHVVVLTFGSSIYTYFTPEERIPSMLRHAFWIMEVARQVSFIGIQMSLVIYERYHSVCVTARAKDMGKGDTSKDFTFRKPLQFKFLAERITLPIAGLLYGTLPAIYVQLAHFWTDSLVYQVSAKPILKDS